MGIKNAEFDADFKSVGKIAENSSRKCDRKIELEPLITEC